MKRTTIMADESLLKRLREQAHREGRSLAALIREGMEWRASRRGGAVPGKGKRGVRRDPRFGCMIGTAKILGDLNEPAADPSEWKALRG